MKILDGRELAGYIKERQARQVRALRQASHVLPTLAIVRTGDDPVIDSYIRLKESYGEDILVTVIVHKVDQADLITTIERLNEDDAIHGIIVQLPLTEPARTDEVVQAIAPAKDVDGLASQNYTPATALAINWLLAGYNIELRDKAIAIVGQGRLVGAPLARLWKEAGYDLSIYDDTIGDLGAELRSAQVIITATGVPGLVTSRMIQPGAVVVDAGTASEHGKIVGDVASDVREREDLTITPEKGGVGPLTVAALFDNVIQAAQATVRN